MEILSNVFGGISLVFYTIVYIPQFYLMYKTKSSSGISVLMLYLWTEADCLSLISTILVQLPAFLIIIGWFHFLIGVFMLGAVLYYKVDKTQRDIVLLALFAMTNTAMTSVLQVYVTPSAFTETLGETVGWITTVIYIAGRLPQIYENYRKKSTKGLSMIMYIFTILGNTFYVLSVFSYSTEYDYIMINMAWIVLAITNVLLDVVVILQSYYYVECTQRKRKNATIEYYI